MTNAQVIILGDIDLSVGSMLAFLSVIGAKVYNALPDTIFSAFIALIAVIIVGAIIGFVSGNITARTKIPAFVTTMAFMEVLRGMGYIITGGSPIPISSDSFKVFGSGWVPAGYTVTYSGSLFNADDLMLKPFEKAVAAIGGRLTAPEKSPVDGAICLAIKEDKMNV